ncbi:unnamed protein product [Gongylonema pulchrum]|uniref:Aa_trans domain-containing protein n=1 Tax=Gongylonema pulchrum TaxID=637853 RepID=A0A183DKZ0_9BILA|nr:unnamed protein product [Gongylonema pulchrum]
MGGDAKHDTNASGGQVKSNKMGLLGAISYIIGNIVGAGLFVTPTSVLEQVDTVFFGKNLRFNQQSNF